MNKCKKGFTLVELIIAVTLLIILFIALYDLYMKNYRIYEDNQNKVKVEIDVKNFSDSLYSYLKGSYQNSIEIINNGTLFIAIPYSGDPVEYSKGEEKGKYSYIEFAKKDDYIEILSVDRKTKESKQAKALKGIVESFTIKPFYSEGELIKLTITLEYSLIRGKTNDIVLDYTIRN